MQPRSINLVLFAVVVIAIVAALDAQPAAANEESGHHEYPHSHFALFVGAGFEQAKNGHKEEGTALGLEYEYQFEEKWGVGVDVERLFGSGTHRSSVAVVPVSFHATENWRLFAGPGFELSETGDKFLGRIGVAYELPLRNRWSVSPEILVDFIEDGANTIVIGIALGRGF